MKQVIAKLVGRRKHRISRWLSTLVLLAFGLSASLAVHAQTVNGSVSGHVTDSTSPVVPNATVTLTDTDTHIASIATLNAKVLYTFPSVKPGNYTMTMTRSSFRSTTLTGLTVDV